MAGLIFLLSTILVRLFCRYATFWGLIDTPNSRSSHQNNTPRGGGIVFVILWLVTILLTSNIFLKHPSDLLLFFPSTLFISLLGLWDDHHSISARKRLMIQIIIATFCVGLLGDVSVLHLFSNQGFYIGWFGSLLAIVAIVWSINLFNFMDGLDGIAGVEALSVLLVGGWLFWPVAPSISQLIWCLAASVAGFLVWNWPKARVFMGDAGSYCLGLLISLFAILGDCRYQISIGYWLILFAGFWVDATLTVIRRFLAGKPLSVAHRDHAYQRLFIAGFSATQILFYFIALNSLLIGIVIWTRFQPQYLSLGLSMAVFLVLLVYWMVERIQPMEKAMEKTKKLKGTKHVKLS